MKKKTKNETLSIELGKLGAKVHEALEAAATSAEMKAGGETGRCLLYDYSQLFSQVTPSGG